MEIFSTNRGQFPEDGEYVCAYYMGGNHIDHDDPFGANWKVVKFHKFPKLKKGEWRCPNNKRDYEWREFGPGKYFGQDMHQWFRLPKLEIPVSGKAN